MLKRASTKLAHNTTVPRLGIGVGGNQELRLLQDLINSEKHVANALERLSNDTMKAAEALKCWGYSEGNDLKDILAISGTLLLEYSETLNRWSHLLNTSRSQLKAIRTRVEDFDELKSQRKSLAAKADSLEKKVNKMAPADQNFGKQNDTLTLLKEDVSKIDANILAEETVLKNYKKDTMKVWLLAKFDQISGVAATGNEVGEYGKGIYARVNSLVLSPSEDDGDRADLAHTGNSTRPISGIQPELWQIPPPLPPRPRVRPNCLTYEMDSSYGNPSMPLSASQSLGARSSASGAPFQLLRRHTMLPSLQNGIRLSGPSGPPPDYTSLLIAAEEPLSHVSQHASEPRVLSESCYSSLAQFEEIITLRAQVEKYENENKTLKDQIAVLTTDVAQNSIFRDQVFILQDECAKLEAENSSLAAQGRILEEDGSTLRWQVGDLTRTCNEWKGRAAEQLSENSALKIQYDTTLSNVIGETSRIRARSQRETERHRSERKKMRDLLRDLSQCSICLGTKNDPVIASCGHSFCKGCIQEQWRALGRKQCALCRGTVNQRLYNAVVLRQVIQLSAELSITSAP